jgi:hypothetical protein
MNEWNSLGIPYIYISYKKYKQLELVPRSLRLTYYQHCSSQRLSIVCRHCLYYI